MQLKKKFFLHILLCVSVPKLIIHLQDHQQAREHSCSQNLQDLITRSKHTTCQLTVECDHHVLPLQRHD